MPPDNDKDLQSKHSISGTEDNLLNQWSLILPKSNDQHLLGVNNEYSAVAFQAEAQISYPDEVRDQ